MIASSISAVRSRGRGIVQLTAGHTHGPITRLMSPGDLGELVKPFVFLDYFETPSSGGPQMADHPHSGIATHTTLLEGSVGYRDSTGKSGTLRAGSVEWMQAGGGVWHGGDLRPGEPVRGYQLWVALPAPLELEPAFSQYLDPGAIESDGRVRVLLGSHGKLRSPIADVSPLTYLHVRLQDGEAWRYQPPVGHDVAWLAVNEGKLHVAGTVVARRMAVFEDGDGALEVCAEGPTELVLGSAARHPHPLVCGYYSVHTSARALVVGEDGIRKVASALRREAGSGCVPGRSDMTVISVILGSIREGRFAEKPARWILQHLKKRDGIDARLLDLRDFPMPFFDQPVPPSTPGKQPYADENVKRWTAAIAESDGFVFVTPEYNYGAPAVLKNAIDWVYPEWNRKAAGFVSYGSAMGARSVQQLRETAIELQLAPVRSSVHIPVPTLWAHYKGGDVDAGLAELGGAAGRLVDDLLWWTTALKTARASGP